MVKKFTRNQVLNEILMDSDSDETFSDSDLDLDDSYQDPDFVQPRSNLVNTEFK